MENANNYSAVGSSVEICIALEDFIYGGKVKVSLPTLHPLLTKDKAVEEKKKINISNLMNKDTSAFNIPNRNCTTRNFIYVHVPEELYRYRNYCSKKLTYKGYKGEQFVVSFIGGDLDQPIVLRRI